MAKLKGWRFVGFVSTLVFGISLAIYPIIVDPMMNVDKYKKYREVAAQRPKKSENYKPTQSESS